MSFNVLSEIAAALRRPPHLDDKQSRFGLFRTVVAVLDHLGIGPDEPFVIVRGAELPEHGLARRDDPETSKKAASPPTFTRGTQARFALLELARYGEAGATTDEVWAQLKDARGPSGRHVFAGRDSLTPRIGNLITHEFVETVGEREGDHGHPQNVNRLTPLGWATAARLEATKED